MSPAMALALVVGLTACDRSPAVRELTPVRRAGGDAGRRAVAGWDDLFDGTTVALQVPQPGPPLLRVAKIAVGSTGTLFIGDPRGHRILAFAPDGRLLRELRVGKDFETPLLGPIALDPDDNLFVYDLAGGWVTVLGKPSYHAVRRFRITGAVGDIVPLRGGAVVTYYPANEEGAFQKFDGGGRRLAIVRPMRDAPLRIFHGRTQNGGITRDPGGDLFGILPAPFELLHFSPDLKVREVLRGAAGDPWAPDAAPFPRQLNPFDQRPAHEAWWDSFMHVGRPYALARGLVLLTVYTSHGLGQAEEFANVYGTDGRVIVEGLRVPHEGLVVGAANGTVYVARNAHLAGRDSLAPLELYVYRLRDRGAVTRVAQVPGAGP